MGSEGGEMGREAGEVGREGGEVGREGKWGGRGSGEGGEVGRERGEVGREWEVRREKGGERRREEMNDRGEESVQLHEDIRVGERPQMLYPLYLTFTYLSYP